MTEGFAKYLRKQNLSDSTVKSYLYAVRQFDTQHGAPTKKKCASTVNGSYNPTGRAQ